MKLYVIILSLLLQGSVWMTTANASEANIEWRNAIGFVKSGQPDFAFMDFHTIAETCPASRHSQDAEFAEGEYYFTENAFSSASATFLDFYAKYPRNEQAMIALAYLYQITKIEKDTKSMEKYRGMIASFRQLTFIFNDEKSFKYVSGFRRKYKLEYTINKAQVYVNGELFTEVSL
jgi:outer membrane protein assembly factor BamD (BamD/ComL family)